MPEINLRELYSQMSPEDQAAIKELSKKIVKDNLVELSQMVADKKLSSTNAKIVYREVMNQPAGWVVLNG